MTAPARNVTDLSAAKLERLDTKVAELESRLDAARDGGGVMDLFDAEPSAMARNAYISPCGKYRYELTRAWASDRPLLPIVMLNPSTADADLDDPTIRRCMAFARREGFGGIRVMNLFAFRATSPDDMRAARDPIGPENYRSLVAMLTLAGADGIPVLAAWGAHGGYRGQDAKLIDLSRFLGARLVCLGTTKDGHPRHPLYVKGNQPFAPLSNDSAAIAPNKSPTKASGHDGGGVVSGDRTA